MSERWLSDAKHKKVVASDMQLATTLAEAVGFEPTRPCGLPDFECYKTLADSRLEQVVTGHLVKVLETQATQGVADVLTCTRQRRFEPSQSSNKTAFLRKMPPFLRVCKKPGKKPETPTAPMKHPFGPQKRKGASS